MATALDSQLDVHEISIQMLQVTLADIKGSLKAVNEECEKQREFQKFVLNWMHHHDSRSNSRSISHFPDSSFSSSSPPPSLLAQLEAIVARSEERSGKSLLHNGCGSKSGIEHETLGGSGITIAQLEAIVSRSEECWSGNGQVQLKAIRSTDDKSMAPFKSPCTQVVDIQSQFHKIGILSDRFQELEGFGTVEGHGMELKTEVKLESSDLVSYKPPKLFVLVADPKPPDPFTTFKSELLWTLFRGWCKTASKVAAGVVGSYLLWLVHGQGRPLKTLSGRPSLGCQVSFCSQS